EALRDPGPLAYAAVVQRVEAWRARAARATLRGVVFGDSVFVKRDGVGFAPALTDALAVRGRRVDLADLSYVGLGAFQFYYAAERVLAGEPRVAVVEVNLRTFAPDWWQTQGLRYPQLSAGLSLRRALGVSEALATQGLSPLAPLVYRMEEVTGTLLLFDGVRRMGGRLLDAVGTRVNDALGLPARSTQDQVQATLRKNLVLDAARARTWYGESFVESPAAAMLRALASDLRTAGVATVFVVAPINVDGARAHGVRLDDLDVRIDRLRDHVRARPDEWLETSDRFHAADFRDAVHLKPAAVERLATLAAERLASQPDSGR
ncbi:MAG TPA: hypothetical protein VKA21_03010, partial [Candidatus Binatia bacterium]|nr:hypothetical protein [Candidatus Binatia bacterium]